MIHLSHPNTHTRTQRVTEISSHGFFSRRFLIGIFHAVWRCPHKCPCIHIRLSVQYLLQFFTCPTSVTQSSNSWSAKLSIQSLQTKFWVIVISPYCFFFTTTLRYSYKQLSSDSLTLILPLLHFIGHNMELLKITPPFYINYINLFF